MSLIIIVLSTSLAAYLDVEKGITEPLIYFIIGSVGGVISGVFNK